MTLCMRLEVNMLLFLVQCIKLKSRCEILPSIFCLVMLVFPPHPCPSPRGEGYFVYLTLLLSSRRGESFALYSHFHFRYLNVSRLFNYLMLYERGVRVTGPAKPEGSGSHRDASNTPFLTFCGFLADMLML